MTRLIKIQTLLTEVLSGIQPETIFTATTAMFDASSLPLYLHILNKLRYNINLPTKWQTSKVLIEKSAIAHSEKVL